MEILFYGTYALGFAFTKNNLKFLWRQEAKAPDKRAHGGLE
jgi:hypothetical protein